MNRPRTYGLAKMIEDALRRPAHRPRVRLHHVADEYSADIAMELRRRWLGHQNVPLSVDKRQYHPRSIGA